MTDDGHPALDRLAAFASGELDEREILTIGTHLDACDTCWKTVQEQPEAALVGLIRSAGLDLEACNDKGSSAELHELADGELDVAIPVELKNHPKYRVLSRLGAGGMGVVLKAHHQLMNRLVALKMVKPHLLGDRQAAERFRREIQAAAKLDHPNIAQAYDADQLGDIQVLVLEYVEGNSLAEVVKQQGPLPICHACDCVRQAAAGLQHAAERGMVHRDIKPQNLMLTKEQVVKILDFGLARWAGELGVSDTITTTGIAMGTPDYIAPEQADDSHDADIRADIYSLGCTLYFLLAGHPPFLVRGAFQKIDAHRNLAARPISEIRTDAPAELADVLAKMMAKDPARRYQSPAEVGEALEPFLAESGSPVPLLPKGRLLGKLLAAVCSAAVLLVLLGAYAFGPVIYRIATNQGELVIETDDPDVEVTIQRKGQQVRILDLKSKQRITLRAGQYELILNEGQERLKLSTGKFSLSRGGQAIVWVRYLQAPPVPPPPKTDAPASPIRVDAIGEVQCLAGHVNAVHAVVFSPDGRHVLSGSQDQTVRLWDLRTGKTIRRFAGSEHHVLTVAFSSDGRKVMAGGEDRIIRVWDTATARPIHTLSGHTHKTWSLAFSPDDTLILSGSEDGTVRLWDAQTGDEIGCLAENQGIVTSVAFSPDGRYAISGSLSSQVCAWDVKLRQQVRVFEQRPDQIWSVAVSPNGKHVLSGGYFPSVLRLWDLNDGTERAQSLQHPHWIHCVAFSPDSRFALSCAGDHTLHLWDCEDWHEVMSFSGHEDHVWSVAFSPDGRYALSGSHDHTIRLWRLPTDEAELRLLRRDLAPHEGLVVWSKGIIIRSSYYHPGDPLTAMNDGILPQSSADMGIPRATWAGRDGSSQWVSYLFPEPQQISTSRVYWYDDTSKNCRCRLPQRWRLLWRTASGEWEPVRLVASEYTTALDQFNEVHFSPVTTRELKMEVELYPFYAGGILEWSVGDP